MKNTTLLVTSSVLSMGSMAAVFDDLARTPPMGWNSWNLFDKDITEQDVMQMADAMVSSGMAEAGYEYIVLDNGWQSGRDSHCQVMTDKERFPHGMRSLADYIHAKGLKFGIYASPPSPVRPEFSGSNGNDLIDAMTYSHWDLDYLKYNWYYSSLSHAPNFYTMMQQALYAVARPVVFRARESDTFPAMKKTGRQSLSGGAINGWEAMIDIFDRQNKLVLKSGPGYWNDPEMLDVGNAHMTTEEYRSHFSLWCMLAAPLMTGNDLRSMSPETLGILTNPEMIAIDQDTLGRQAFCSRNFDVYEVWIKLLENDEAAVCLLNRTGKERIIPVNAWEWLNACRYYFESGSCNLYDYTIRDVWEHSDIQHKGGAFEVILPAHGVKVFWFERVREEGSFGF